MVTMVVMMVAMIVTMVVAIVVVVSLETGLYHRNGVVPWRHRHRVRDLPTAVGRGDVRPCEPNAKLPSPVPPSIVRREEGLPLLFLASVKRAGMGPSAGSSTRIPSAQLLATVGEGARNDSAV